MNADNVKTKSNEDGKEFLNIMLNMCSKQTISCNEYKFQNYRKLSLAKAM